MSRNHSHHLSLGHLRLSPMTLITQVSSMLSYSISLQHLQHLQHLQNLRPPRRCVGMIVNGDLWKVIPSQVMRLSMGDQQGG